LGTELTRHHIAIIDHKQIAPSGHGAAPLARYALVTGVGALGALHLPLSFFLPFPTFYFVLVLVLGVIAATSAAAAAAPVVTSTTAVPKTAFVHEDGWRAHTNDRHLMREAIRGHSVPTKGAIKGPSSDEGGNQRPFGANERGHQRAIGRNQKPSGNHLPPVARRQQIGGHEREAQRASEGVAKHVPEDGAHQHAMREAISMQ